jgi:hypothetical protein
MWHLNFEDRTRLGSILANRAVSKASDADAARYKQRHPSLIASLEADAEWCRDLAAKLLGDEPFEG